MEKENEKMTKVKKSSRSYDKPKMSKEKLQKKRDDFEKKSKKKESKVPGKSVSAWIQHVRKVQKDKKINKWKNALKEASKTWKMK